MENQELQLEEKTLTPIFPCEWCFKFDDDEPTVFAATNEKINDQEPAIRLTLSNTEEANVSFTHNGKTFNLFCRPLTEVGDQLINQNNKQDDEVSSGL